MSEVILSQVDQETSDKPKRKTIGDKLRFEVFKRDNFKCQYCGMSAPDVVLNVDHIDPVSNGGENDILNLVTSCRDCNSGKSDRLLSEHSMLDKQRKMLEDLEERRQQLQMMIQWREQLSNFDEEQASALAKIINEKLKPVYVTEAGITTIGEWLNRFKLDELVKVVDEMIVPKTKDNSIDGAEFMAKIPRIAAANRKPEVERELLYIRGILRKRLSYIDERKTLMWLHSAVHAGYCTDELKHFATVVRSWTEFKNDIVEMIAHG
jgi:hypothetical protein